MGGPLGLVGHGTRERMLWGPLSAVGRPESIVFEVRRYRCRHCQRTTTVVPRGLLYRRLYNAVAIALGLGLWAVERLATHGIRSRVSPHRGAPSEREHGWRSLGRWSRDAQKLWPWLSCGHRDGRLRGAEVVQQLAGRALSTSGPLVELACEGAPWA